MFYQIKSILSPCKLYPKIFGGYNANTFSYAIDGNLTKDLIVVGGRTADPWLAGVRLNGGAALFVSAFSISTTTIYWAKSDASKSWYLPISLSLSPNANYVIALIN